jgi:hypothetical protein
LARLIAVGTLLLVGLLVVAVAVLMATNPAPRDTSAWRLAAPPPEGRGEVATAGATAA